LQTRVFFSGSPISPLLSNLYMRRFVLGGKKLGHEKRWKAYIVNYADDLVICCRGNAEEALGTMRNMMTKLKLTVNECSVSVEISATKPDVTKSGKIRRQSWTGSIG
jgi:hypothetical protein